MKKSLVLLLVVATFMSCKKIAGEVVLPHTAASSLIASIDPLSGHLNTSVLVGDQNRIIGGFKIVAGATSTDHIIGLNIAFHNRGTGDYQLVKYAATISVWLNGTQVGSLPATSFTVHNNIYSAYIPVSMAALKPGSVDTLSIAMSALPVIETLNLGAVANTFAFEVPSIVYNDISHVYTIPSNKQFDNGDIVNGQLQSSFVFAAWVVSTPTLTITKDATDYVDRVVQGLPNSTMSNITLGLIDVSAQRSAIMLQQLPIHLAVTNNGSGGTRAGSLITTLRLYNSSGVLIDSEPVPTSTNPQVVFKNLACNFLMGTTNLLTIKGDLTPIDGSTVTQGASAQISVTDADVSAIQAYDSNNNLLSGATALLGSVSGSHIYFYVNGIQVSSTGGGSATAATIGGSQTHNVVTMVIPFSVTAYGTTAYVPSVTSLSIAGTVNNPVATANASIQYAVDNGSTLQTGATATITYTGNDALTLDANGNYQIPVGQTKTFNLVVTYTPSGPGSYRAQLVNVNWNTTDSGLVYTTFTAGLNSNMFRTNYVAAQ